MMSWIIGGLTALGLYLLLTAALPSLYAPARKALRARAPKTLTAAQVLQNSVAEFLAPHLSLDPIERGNLENILRNLGHTETPELFQARAMARGMFLAAMSAVLLFISVPLGALAMVVIGGSYYKRQTASLDKELAERRTVIERELPQFASTIRQSLNSTRDIPTILGAYRRICGPALAGEIDKTLNDMVTGNAERAIRAFETRVASPQLSQLTRGLLGVLHGDDQRVYFDLLTEDYRKLQNEIIERELLKRPEKLYPYMGALFVCLALMMIVAIGGSGAAVLKGFF